jgi:hypothetical protein
VQEGDNPRIDRPIFTCSHEGVRAFCNQGITDPLSVTRWGPVFPEDRKARKIIRIDKVIANIGIPRGTILIFCIQSINRIRDNDFREPIHVIDVPPGVEPFRHDGLNYHTALKVVPAEA